MEIKNRRFLNMFIVGGISENPIREFKGLPVYSTGLIGGADVCIDEINNEMMYLDGDNIRVVSIEGEVYKKMNLRGKGIRE